MKKLKICTYKNSKHNCDLKIDAGKNNKHTTINHKLKKDLKKPKTQLHKCF
jgi:hypothetical protein